MKQIFKRTAFVMLGLLAFGVLIVLGTLIYQGQRTPAGRPEYVALGSSFAAGLGLGPQAPGSPVACQRSVGGYPAQLARATRLSLVDMSCSGSTAEHVLHGGQFFQKAQTSAIRPSTRLVTLTTGGNDISYIGDLVMMAYRNRGGLLGWLAGTFADAPHSASERDIGKLEVDISAAIVEVRRRAPKAQIVVVTYPAVLPERGTCTALNLTESQVAAMRPVAASLADATRRAARSNAAMLVDMAMISRGHDACSSAPWTNGLVPANGAPFHPNQAGAAAVAREIARIVEPGLSNEK